MEETFVYKDKLIEISSDFILFKNYYFPLIGSKRVPFNRIKSISVEEPSLLKGQWRIWGTGNFTIWFPLDFERSKRDKIFILSMIGKRVRIGFTTENSETVLQIFKQRGFIHQAIA